MRSRGEKQHSPTQRKVVQWPAATKRARFRQIYNGGLWVLSGVGLKRSGDFILKRSISCRILLESSFDVDYGYVIRIIIYFKL